MKEEQIKRFINNKLMSEAVYGIILDDFLKPRRISDVNFLAASRIAIDIFKEAWKELESIGRTEKREIKTLEQIGL